MDEYLTVSTGDSNTLSLAKMMHNAALAHRRGDTHILEASLQFGEQFAGEVLNQFDEDQIRGED